MTTRVAVAYAMGIGIVASTVTLVLVNRINLDLPPSITVKLILLEMVPTSFGASLAINQLGGSFGSKKSLEDQISPDFRKLLATSLGALMFSFNIAPTIETQLIGNSLNRGHLIGLVVFSLAVSALMVFLPASPNEELTTACSARTGWKPYSPTLSPLPSARFCSGCSDFWIDRDPRQGTLGFDIGTYRVS